MNKSIKAANHDMRGGMLRRLGLVASFCATLVQATFLSGLARANDGDGLRVERDFKRKQCDCAFRWRDHWHKADISMVGCGGFGESTPDAAKAALAAGAYLY
jgi:hypothetical protein